MIRTRNLTNANQKHIHKQIPRGLAVSKHTRYGVYKLIRACTRKCIMGKRIPRNKLRINEQERKEETHFVTHCDRVPKYITINILLVYSVRISCKRSILFLRCNLWLFSVLFFMLGIQRGLQFLIKITLPYLCIMSAGFEVLAASLLITRLLGCLQRLEAITFFRNVGKYSPANAA